MAKGTETMSITIRGSLPKGDLNGLTAVEEQARLDKDSEVLLVVRAHTRKVTENVGDDADPWTVTLGISQVEAIRGGDADFVMSTMQVAYEQRTGKVALPFGTVVDHEPDGGDR